MIEPNNDTEPRRVYAARLPVRLHRRARVLAAARGWSNAQLMAMALAALDREMRARRRHQPTETTDDE